MAKIHSIRGNKYKIRFVSSRLLGKDHDGECDEPIFEVNEIRINKNLTGKRLLEVIIHEVTHGAKWKEFSEKFVGEFSSDLADILDYYGYKRVPDDTSKAERKST